MKSGVNVHFQQPHLSGERTSYLSLKRQFHFFGFAGFGEVLVHIPISVVQSKNRIRNSRALGSLSHSLKSNEYVMLLLSNHFDESRGLNISSKVFFPINQFRKKFILKIIYKIISCIKRTLKLSSIRKSNPSKSNVPALL